MGIKWFFYGSMYTMTVIEATHMNCNVSANQQITTGKSSWFYCIRPKTLSTSTFTISSATMSCAIFFFPLLWLWLHQHPLSQMSSMACGLTMLVNIYCFFRMIDMELLVSLLLQRRVWKFPEDGGRRKDHLRAAEMIFNKELWARHWISTTSSANQSANKQNQKL